MTDDKDINGGSELPKFERMSAEEMIDKLEPWQQDLIDVESFEKAMETNSRIIHEVWDRQEQERLEQENSSARQNSDIAVEKDITKAQTARNDGLREQETGDEKFAEIAQKMEGSLAFQRLIQDMIKQEIVEGGAAVQKGTFTEKEHDTGRKL